MNRGNIPGYYYDEEKGKYFKIQKAQYAPEGAKYSYDNYKRENEARTKRKREEDHEKKRSRQLVTKPRISRNPLATGIGTRSETGLKTSSEIKDLRSQAFAQGLQKRVILDLSDDGDKPRSGLVPIRHGTEIMSFDYDKETKGLILGMHMELPSSVDSLVSVLPDEETQTSRRAKYSYHNIRPIMHFHSSISSTSLTSQRTLVTTSTGSRHPPNIFITNLLDPLHVQRGQPLDGHCSINIRPPQLTTIWCSAASPTASHTETQRIALGTGMGIVIIDNERETWKTSTASRWSSDILALDWLSPLVLTGGLRSGGIIIYDCRSRGGVQRFTHPGPVVSLKAVDGGRRIIAAGMSSSMAMYDWRMLKEETSILRKGAGHWEVHNDSDSEVKWNAPTRKKVRSPRPVVKFRYQNEFMYPLGMDVCAELGFVAAAEDDGNISIWSLRNGEKIRTLSMISKKGEQKAAVGTARGVGEMVKCLRFVEDEGGPPRLMASKGAKIVEWAW